MGDAVKLSSLPVLSSMLRSSSLHEPTSLALHLKMKMKGGSCALAPVDSEVSIGYFEGSAI